MWLFLVIAIIPFILFFSVSLCQTGWFLFSFVQYCDGLCNVQTFCTSAVYFLFIFIAVHYLILCWVLHHDEMISIMTFLCFKTEDHSSKFYHLFIPYIHFWFCQFSHFFVCFVSSPWDLHPNIHCATSLICRLKVKCCDIIFLWLTGHM